MLDKQKIQTRGRPKKTNYQKIPLINKQFFSQHSAVFYTHSMHYVMDAFINTKNLKRIGHADGGFTIYQIISQQYCFHNFQQDCIKWGFYQIRANQNLYSFAKIINGSAPKFVFKQLLALIVEIINFIQDLNIASFQQLDNKQETFLNCSESQLNKKYKYIRFTYSALKQLKMQKWSFQIAIKIKQIWIQFLRIIMYTVFCVINDFTHNKYYKTFLSQSQNPLNIKIHHSNISQNGNGMNSINSFEKKKLTSLKLGEDKQYFSQHKIKSTVNLRPIMLITQPSIQFDDFVCQNIKKIKNIENKQTIIKQSNFQIFPNNFLSLISLQQIQNNEHQIDNYSDQQVQCGQNLLKRRLSTKQFSLSTKQLSLSSKQFSSYKKKLKQNQ